MNKLMIELGATMTRYMDEAGDPAGGGNTHPAGDPAPAGDPPPAGDAKPAGDTATAGEEKPEGEKPAGSAKPYLGEEGEKKPDGENKPAEGEKKPVEEKPPEITEQSYIDGIKADAKEFGENAKLDEGLIKALAPTLKESGISVENANMIANEIAKYQVAAAREAYRARVEAFQKMNAESIKRYTPADFKTINAGIDACFKRGGAMNHVIRNSELGADPEFLALMLEVGKRHIEDTGSGGATGGGAGAGDPNGIDGLAKMW